MTPTISQPKTRKPTKTAIAKEETARKPASNRQHEITLELTHKFFKARTAYLTCQGLPASKQKALASALNKSHKALDSKIHKLWCDAFDAPESED